MSVARVFYQSTVDLNRFEQFICGTFSVLVLAITTIVCSVVAQQQVNPCQGVQGGFAQDLDSCNHFIVCDNGQQRSRGACPDNTRFDVERQACVAPADSRCFQCPPRGHELFSVPRSCNQFVQCFNGRPTLHACPSGLSFNGRPGVRECDVTCQPSTPAGPTPTQRCPSQADNNAVFFQDGQNCNSYFVCSQSNAAPERRECPSGLHFNFRDNACDRPQNAGCNVSI